MSLKGKAKEMVKNKLHLPSMVPEIIQTLRLCFGRPEHILERAMSKARCIPVVKDKLESLIEFALCVRNIYATIESCHLDMHMHNPLLVKELVDKLPNNHKLNWAMYPKDPQIPVVKIFSDWLYQLAEAASTVVNLYPGKGSASLNVHAVPGSYDDNKERLQSNYVKERLCVICKSAAHKVPQCEKFKNATLDRKWQFVRSENLCRQCLGKHRNKCYLNKICGIDGCSAKHNQLLHKHNETARSEMQTTPSEAASVAEVHTHRSFKNNSSIFRIVPIKVYSSNKIVETLAFLDEGSAVTLIEKSLFDKLDLEGVQSPLCLRWTGDTTREEHDSVKANIQISAPYDTRKHTLVSVHTVKNLDLPSQSLNTAELKRQYPYLKGLPIQSYEERKPEILIGVNNWKLGVPLKIKEGNWNQPIASKTRLGWTLQGFYGKDINNHRLNIHLCDCQKELDELNEMVKEYFLLEECKPVKLLSINDNRAIQIVDGTCQKVGDRYETGLPWRNDNVVLPESYENALRRSECLQKKLDKDINLKSVVKAQIQNLIDKGYAVKLSANEAKAKKDKIWYLPIFTVINPNKPNKVRLVWDAAAKSKNVSLNDFLLSGPDLLNSLFDVLLAFRVGKIAVCADIAEMFHRINVKESDQDAQRFLWWNDNDDPRKPSIYVMRALTFGVCCAPFIAHFVRNKNAQMFLEKYPRAVEAIQKYHYVDDFIDSEDDEFAAIRLAKQVKSIHSAAGFNIRDWSSNCRRLVEELNADAETSQNIKEWGSATKVLGMYWDPTNDVFKYVCRFARLKRDVINSPVIPTKRETLQVLMSVFDPLGLASCYTIELKILLQRVWRTGIKWDDPLTYELYDDWCKWKKDMSTIASLEIPRCFSSSIWSASTVELHTFVDAGENAYAAVCYLRIVKEEGTSIALVAAKSKVAPLKPLSIPRLELQAAIIGVRIAKMVLKVKRIPITSQFWWTDSKTVLKWLRMDPKNFQQYVMHRVGEILESSNVSQWKYVPSKLNPADVATKISTRSNRQLWFTGPDFLKGNPDFWPQSDIEKCNESNDDELKKCVLVVRNENKPLQLNLEYFSNWRRLYRAVATFMLYIEKLKSKSSIKTNLTFYDMIQKAKIFLFKFAQCEEYHEDIKILESNNTLMKNSRLISLNVYLDDNNLIRCRGRLEYLNNHQDAIVLPNTHYITFLLVRSIHEDFHHQMHETIINKIRSKYYISKLRVLYRKVRRFCQFCKNNLAKPQLPKMAPLPKARLAAFERPFTFVGLDYFGPIKVCVGRRSEKRWGVIFTCLTLRAIHIEVAHTLDTSSCVMAIRSFISRRGSPREIFSDNGTNFTATEKILCDQLKKKDVSLAAAKFEQIKWNFNPPAAPHMGGIWERLVRTVKTVLYAICPAMTFTDESLRCALAEVEFIINSRPLTYVSLDSIDDEAITPNHLLIGSSDGYKPVYGDNADLRQRWHQTQKFADQFWCRWVKEYIPIITRRSKWFTKQQPVKVGDVVVIVDEDLPRNCWLKGIVIETLKAKDDQVNSVTVRTKSSILRRPVAKIAVLDVGCSEGKL